MSKQIPDNNGRTYEKQKPDSARVFMFKQFFLNPTSDTFWNIRGSAIRAGYSEQYAENISNNKPKWWLELKETAEFRRASMLETAEKNIDRRLKKTPETPLQEKLQADMDKFVSERVGKDHYSTRKELTGAEGRKLFTNETASEQDVELDTLFVGVSAPDDTTSTT